MILGRFELKRVLGEGAQATVWLGFDKRLEREVAVKLMRADDAADSTAVNVWLQEARSVSRLTHPNIVPVFEADVHERQAYLVFEYVAGPTLSQHLKTRGTLAAHEAVAMMLGVLDALEAAHVGGVVHRDLKPSNILVDGSGRARVMDFGIAARLHDPGNLDQIVGTPGYMSPEAAQGGLPTAAMDVFSAGVVLVELLSGKKLIAERDPFRAMYRVANEDLKLPDDMSSSVDDTLRAVLMRAIERQPAQRWQSAAAFRDALQKWLSPPPSISGSRNVTNDGVQSGGQSAGGANGTLDFLLRRMRHKSDFPALSDSVARIQRVASSENESLASLSSEILKDVALTNKLLRLVNTAHFSNAGGNISTVSRAVALIGFAGVRNLAMSLVLLEHMQDKAHANQLKEEFLRSLMAGMLASELGAIMRDSEEAFIGAMFQNLGRLLTEFYFPEEANQVRGIVANGRQNGSPVGEDWASISVLGLSFEALGLGVAKAWGLPTSLQACMRKPQGEPPLREPQQANERLRWLAFAANQITDTLMCSDPEQVKTRVADVAKRHARSLGLDAARIEAAAEIAQQRLVQMAQAMNLQVSVKSPARRLFAAPSTSKASSKAVLDIEAATLRLEHDSLVPHSLQATITVTQQLPRTALDNACEVLAAGIQDITNTMVENFKLNDVLRMILETMFRALGFRRIVFCLRDPKTETLTGRFGLGDGAEAVAKNFKVPLKGGTDLFTAVCLKGADTLITDATVAHIAARLPQWYRAHVNAPAFLLLPMLIKGAPFALIYADKAVPGGIELGEKELSLLRTLRNQAVMAFKQMT
jgi:serine/threonine protein kinase